jgi:riboflavin kinase / FMN adenylyltransferase
MRVIRNIAHAGPAAELRVVAAGAFDGLHRGHQQVLARVVECAREIGGEPVAIVARGDGGGLRLSDRRQQLEGLRAAGIALVAFAPRAALDAAVTALAATVRIVEQAATVDAPAGGRLERVATVAVGGQRVTAQAIGAALALADLDTARAMLGRDPSVAGRVVHGYHRGAALGIPTANLRPRGLQLPPDGVYAVRARIAGAHLRGVANLGFNPTFGNQTRTVEAHLFDFNGDLYGRRIEIGFVARLRGERTFADVPALLAQIRLDIATARRFFEAHGD